MNVFFFRNQQTKIDLMLTTKIWPHWAFEVLKWITGYTFKCKTAKTKSLNSYKKFKNKFLREIFFL